VVGAYHHDSAGPWRRARYRGCAGGHHWPRAGRRARSGDGARPLPPSALDHGGICDPDRNWPGSAMDRLPDADCRAFMLRRREWNLVNRSGHIALGAVRPPGLCGAYGPACDAEFDRTVDGALAWRRTVGKGWHQRGAGRSRYTVARQRRFGRGIRGLRATADLLWSEVTTPRITGRAPNVIDARPNQSTSSLLRLLLGRRCAASCPAAPRCRCCPRTSPDH